MASFWRRCEALYGKKMCQCTQKHLQLSIQSGALSRSVLSDERERRVAYLLYHCGLKPVEIVRTYPQEFNDVQEIHHVRRVVIEKMRTFL